MGCFAKGHPDVDLPELQRRFGKVVLRRRLEAQLSQEKLAETAGVHRNHLSLIERGKHLPNLALVHGLAGVFGVSMSALLAEAESEAAPADEPPALSKGRPRKETKAKGAKARRDRP